VITKGKKCTALKSFELGAEIGSTATQSDMVKASPAVQPNREINRESVHMIQEPERPAAYNVVAREFAVFVW